jgi:hypothetical protein
MQQVLPQNTAKKVSNIIRQNEQVAWGFLPNEKTHAGFAPR